MAQNAYLKDFKLPEDEKKFAQEIFLIWKIDSPDIDKKHQYGTPSPTPPRPPYSVPRLHVWRQGANQRESDIRAILTLRILSVQDEPSVITCD